jgi:uncharacterized protein
MKAEIKGFKFTDFKSLDVEQCGRFKGYLSTFGNVDHDNDVVKSGAFKTSLKEWSAKGQMPAMYWNHDDNEPVGDWLEMVPDDVGLAVVGQLHMDGKVAPTQATIKAYRVTTGNGPKAMSMGFQTRKAAKRADGARELQDVHLIEGSIVQFPANDLAAITGAKSSVFVGDDGVPIDIREMEKLLRDGGLSARQAKALLAGGYRNLLRDAQAVVENEETLRYAKELADRINLSMAAYQLNESTNPQ